MGFGGQSMMMVRFFVLLATTALAGACSNAASPRHQPQTGTNDEFTPGSRSQFDGVLLDLGSGGRLGIIDIKKSSANPDRIFAETILLQRRPAGPPQQLPATSQIDATSQVIEIECSTHRHRIVANLNYRRDGDLISSFPVETAFTDFAGYQGTADSICDGSFPRNPILRFTSIATFLDLAERPDLTRLRPTGRAGSGEPKA